MTIPAGQTQAVFPVPITSEPPGAPTTSFTVTLSGAPSGTVIVDPTATVTLISATTNATVAPTPTAPTLVHQSPPTTAVGNAPYSYTFTATGYPTPSFSVVEGEDLPPGITLDPTGILAGSPNQDGSYTFSVIASNGFGTAAVSAPITITVTGASTSPQFVNDAPPSNATVGTPYSYTFTASGSPAPTYTVSSGALPPGLSLQNQTGVLSGTPTTVGTYNFQVQAANTSGGEPDITPTITIGIGTGSAAPAITTTASSTSVQVGQGLSFAVTASGSPLPTLSVTGTLPAGISFANIGDGSGTFSGVPPAGTEGSYPVTVTATNGVSPAATKAFTIVVTGIAPAFVNQSAPGSATVGAAYSYTYTATGDPAPTFSLAGGSLPPGLTIGFGGAVERDADYRGDLLVHHPGGQRQRDACRVIQPDGDRLHCHLDRGHADDPHRPSIGGDQRYRRLRRGRQEPWPEHRDRRPGGPDRPVRHEGDDGADRRDLRQRAAHPDRGQPGQWQGHQVPGDLDALVPGYSHAGRRHVLGRQ